MAGEPVYEKSANKTRASRSFDKTCLMAGLIGRFVQGRLFAFFLFPRRGAFGL